MEKSQAQEKSKPQPPAMLTNLDMTLRATLEAKNAPEKVMKAWDDFYTAACEWAAEGGL